ncbi:MAG: hypothetical protein ACC645_25085, partial [Pirellulales bacterium]
DALNWNGPIPDAAGDVARLQQPTGETITIDLLSPVTLGQLELTGAAAFTLIGPGPLLFDNSLEAASLNVSATSQPQLGHRLEVPIVIGPTEQLLLDIAPQASLTLGGGIAQDGGDLVKGNAGTLTLAGASPNWGGRLRIDDGELRVEHTEALLNAAALNAKPNSTITIVSTRATAQNTSDPYVIPQISLDRATLQTDLGFAKINANVELLGDSVIRVPTSNSMILKGNLTGSGGVSFLQGFNPSPSHRRTLLQVDGSTSYSGETIIGPNIWVEFLQAGALGDTNGDTRVLQGTLGLNQGGGAEEIFVDQGELHLGEATVPYGHTVRFHSGKLTGGSDDRGSAVLNTRVTYTDGAVFGSESSADDLVLAGGVDGIGSLLIQNKVEIQGGVTVRGNLYISNRAGAQLSGPLDLAGETFFNRSQLKLTGNINAADAAFRLAATERGNVGLTASASNTLGTVVLDPRLGVGSQLVTEGNAVLTITDRLRFMGGMIHGAIAGQPVLTKEDRTDGILEDIAGSEFERVNVEAGRLIVRGDAGVSVPDIYLQPHDTSSVWIENAGVYRGDIYLNNHLSSFLNFETQAALTIIGDTTLAGDIFLGAQGASLSGSTDDASIGSEGAIHGGDLTLLGRAPIRIRGGNHTYSGVTNVMAESLILVDGGRLSSTSAIVGAGRFQATGGRSGLARRRAPRAFRR